VHALSLVGIVCEYDPLHTGHVHQIRTLTDEGHRVIAIMSGNFVQRSVPSVYDKFVRTRMALASGVSMVVELPTLYSTATAENFAFGAMVLAKGSGIIDAISFGMEDPSCLPLLKEAAALSSPETPLYKETLRHCLEKGLPFPKAREAALSQLLSRPLPTEPNHILVLEYLRAARRLGYCPDWLPIRRQGAGYHDLTDPSQTDYPSASALRKRLHSGEDIRDYIPKPARDYLPSEYVREDSLFPYIRYVLSSMSSSELAGIDEVAEGFENRILEAIPDAVSYESLLHALKTARYPTSRIRRILLNAALSITREKKVQLRYSEGPSYLRVLGVRRDAMDLLSQLSASAALPTLIRPVRDRLILSPEAESAFEEEQRFSRIYHLVSPDTSFAELKEGLILF